MATTKIHGVAIVTSIAVHALVTGGASWLAFGGGSGPTPSAQASESSAQSAVASSIAVDLPSVADGIAIEKGPDDPVGEPPRVTGGDTTPHLDTERAGRGGDLRVPQPAINLADADERMRLSQDLVSRIDRDQVQRLRAAAHVRASWEDRRSTTHPAELTLVATGPGRVLQRRPPSPFEPSRGALSSPSARSLGGESGAAPPGAEGDTQRRPGGAWIGSNDPSPGAGVLEARAGIDHRASAPVGSARPDVTRGPVAVPAERRARPRDDVESDQEVATTLRSLVQASTAGGAAGEGQGGTGGGGEAGAGAASGSGSRARPLGVGDGEVFDYWTSDPRLLPYFRRIHAKIDPLWADAFPKSALLDLKQGTVILEFSIFADGHVNVGWPPVRPSGIDEFDRNCAEAVRRAAPLPAIPRDLGVQSLRVRAPFVVNNPVVK